MPKITLEKYCFANRGQLDPSTFRTGGEGGGGGLICNPKKKIENNPYPFLPKQRYSEKYNPRANGAKRR